MAVFMQTFTEETLQHLNLIVLHAVPLLSETHLKDQHLCCKLWSAKGKEVDLGFLVGQVEGIMNFKKLIKGTQGAGSSAKVEALVHKYVKVVDPDPSRNGWWPSLSLRVPPAAHQLSSPAATKPSPPDVALSIPPAVSQSSLPAFHLSSLIPVQAPAPDQSRVISLKPYLSLVYKAFVTKINSSYV